MKTKKIVSLLLAGVMMTMSFAGCSSKKYPSNNINVTIPYSPGGPTDMSVRGLLDNAGKKLPKGVSFVAANKTGAGGIIGMTETANSKPDGYNIGVIAVDLLMQKYLGKTELGLDNYIPIAATMADPYGLVVKADATYKTVDEFIKYAKDHPGEVTVGNSAAGGAPHLAALAFEKQFGLKFKHIAYNGSADCIAAIVGGHINATFTQPSPAKSQMDAKVLKMLGVLDKQRMKGYPDVPTVNEVQKIDFTMRGWVVVCAPSKMAKDQVDYLKNIFENSVKDPEYQKVITSLGMQPVVIVGDDLTKMLKDDDTFYKNLMKDIKIN